MSANVSEITAYSQKIWNQAQRLISLEKILSEQVYQLEGSSSMSQSLKLIGTQKEQLFTHLQTLYRVRSEMAQDSAGSFVSIRGLKNSIKKQISETDKLIKAIEDQIAGKKRMTEIAEYQYHKYLSYKKILKLVSFCSIGIILIVFLIKSVPALRPFGIGFIVLVGTYLLYQFGYMLLMNFRRDDKYWHKFKQGSPIDYDSDTGRYSGDSKWEHNKKAFKKLWGGIGGAEGACKFAAEAVGESADDALSRAQE